MGHKEFLKIIIVCSVMWAMASTARAAFNSGSTGADGALTPTTNTTLQVPPSGVFNFTAINIPTGVTVTFTPNASNTPVTILASGDVVINGTINVAGNAGSSGSSGGLGGTGGPGGFRGGSGSNQSGVNGGSGFGPGGGQGGVAGTTPASAGGGSFGTAGGTNSGPTYGTTVLLPPIGGSGGGGGASLDSGTGGGGGGSGGGVLIIASSGNITINSANVIADGGVGGNGILVASGGGSGGGGGGSGGAIRLIANTISGTGNLFARGGSGGTGGNIFSPVNGTAGGKGRIRLEAFTITGITTDPPASSGLPTVVALTNPPALRITSVAGQAAPAVPTGGSGGIDITLPPQTAPVSIVVAGSKVPTGTTVTVTVLPQAGTPVTATGTLTGTFDSSTTSVSLTLPSGLSFITATATFSSGGSAALESPFLIGGEPVEKIRVATRYSEGSSVTYITKSGKEIPIN